MNILAENCVFVSQKGEKVGGDVIEVASWTDVFLYDMCAPISCPIGLMVPWHALACLIRVPRYAN